MVKPRQFAADGAASDDGHRLWNGFGRQRVPVSDDFISVDRREGEGVGAGAGGNNDALGRDVLFAIVVGCDFHTSVGQQVGAALQQRDIVFLQ